MQVKSFFKDKIKDIQTLKSSNTIAKDIRQQLDTIESLYTNQKYVEIYHQLKSLDTFTTPFSKFIEPVPGLKSRLESITTAVESFEIAEAIKLSTVLKNIDLFFTKHKLEHYETIELLLLTFGGKSHYNDLKNALNDKLISDVNFDFPWTRGHEQLYSNLYSSSRVPKPLEIYDLIKKLEFFKLVELKDRMSIGMTFNTVYAYAVKGTTAIDQKVSSNDMKLIESKMNDIGYERVKSLYKLGRFKDAKKGISTIDRLNENALFESTANPPKEPLLPIEAPLGGTTRLLELEN